MQAEILAALSAIAAAAGTTVVEAATTDIWNSVKTSFARLLGRGNSEQEAAHGELFEQARQAIRQAPQEQRDEVMLAQRTLIQGLLLQAMIQNRGLADEMQALVANWHGQPAAGSQTATASGHAQQAVQYRGVQHNKFGQAPGD